LRDSDRRSAMAKRLDRGRRAVACEALAGHVILNIKWRRILKISINRHHVEDNLFSIAVHDLAPRITKPGREALALLEKWDLAEPADGINGMNGYMVLTDEGKVTTERTDFERDPYPGRAGSLNVLVRRLACR
jgi:hypothetical protein